MSGFLGKSFKQALGAVSKAMLDGSKNVAVKAVAANIPDSPRPSASFSRQIKGLEDAPVKSGSVASNPGIALKSPAVAPVITAKSLFPPLPTLETEVTRLSAKQSKAPEYAHKTLDLAMSADLQDMLGLTLPQLAVVKGGLIAAKGAMAQFLMNPYSFIEGSDRGFLRKENFKEGVDPSERVEAITKSGVLHASEGKYKADSLANQVYQAVPVSGCALMGPSQDDGHWYGIFDATGFHQASFVGGAGFECDAKGHDKEAHGLKFKAYAYFDGETWVFGGEQASLSQLKVAMAIHQMQSILACTTIHKMLIDAKLPIPQDSTKAQDKRSLAFLSVHLGELETWLDANARLPAAARTIIDSLKLEIRKLMTAMPKVSDRVEEVKEATAFKRQVKTSGSSDSHSVPTQ